MTIRLISQRRNEGGSILTALSAASDSRSGGRLLGMTVTGDKEGNANQDQYYDADYHQDSAITVHGGNSLGDPSREEAG